MLTGVVLPRDVVHVPDDAVDRAVEAVVVLRSQSEGDARACERPRHENGRTATPFSGAGGEAAGRTGRWRRFRLRTCGPGPSPVPRQAETRSRSCCPSPCSTAVRGVNHYCATESSSRVPEGACSVDGGVDGEA